jgi:hypothetical protein
VIYVREKRCDDGTKRRTIACNGAGGRVGFEINVSRAGPLMRSVLLQIGAYQMAARHLSRSWLLMFALCMLLCCGWAIDRYSLKHALEDEQRHAHKLATAVDRLKTHFVVTMMAPSTKVGSIDTHTCQALADKTYQKKPAGANAGAIWTAVFETRNESKLTGYHFHFDNWGDDPDRDMPCDVHIFADESGHIIAVGREQGLASGVKSTRPCVSIYKNEQWHLKLL